MTRMASQAFNRPMLNGASLPPAIARSTSPLRTIRKAWPIAWLAEEQAVEIVKAGPVVPNSTEMWLAPAFAMVRGIVRSEEHTSELQSQSNLVCRLLLEKKKKINT